MNCFTQARRLSTAERYMAAYDMAVQIIREIDDEARPERMARIAAFWSNPEPTPAVEVVS